MTEDWLMSAMEALECAAAAARDALGRAVEVLTPARALRRAGAPLPAIAEQLHQAGLQPRLDAGAALLHYEQAVATLRAAVVCALVDEEGVTFSQLAKRMGVSRQTITRLYEAGKRAHEGQ